MKRFLVLLLIFTIGFISCKTSKKKKPLLVTESNYVKADNKIWDEYDNSLTTIDSLYKILPNKKDSIKQIYRLLEKETLKKNIDTAITYASTKSGLKRLFMLRLDIPKNILSETLNSISKELKDSKYGKSLKSFIENNQVTKGMSFYDFKVTNSQEKSQLLSTIIKDKNVLLLYGGLKCIGIEGRKYLKELYDKTRSSNLQIIVFEPSSNLEELKSQEKKHKTPYLFISDFLLDHSPMKINYGAQTLPTSFLIDEKGIVITITEGIPDKKIKELFYNKNN